MERQDSLRKGAVMAKTNGAKESYEIIGILTNGPGEIDFLLSHARGALVGFTVAQVEGHPLPYSSRSPQGKITASRHRNAHEVLNIELRRQMKDLNDVILEIEVDSYMSTLTRFRAFYSLRSHRGFVLEEYTPM